MADAAFDGDVNLLKLTKAALVFVVNGGVLEADGIVLKPWNSGHSPFPEAKVEVPEAGKNLVYTN